MGGGGAMWWGYVVGKMNCKPMKVNSEYHIGGTLSQEVPHFKYFICTPQITHSHSLNQ